MKSTWYYILLFLFAYQPIRAQEPEKPFLWEVELQGALTYCSTWEIEPIFSFLPCKYAGVSMGLLFTSPNSSTSANGVTADHQFLWSSTYNNAASYLFAWRPALRLNTPKLWLGRDKEYALFLSVSPGLTLPFPADRQFSIDYYPNRTGVWTALKREQVKNSGARKVYYHLRTALSLEIDDRLILSAGYTFSDFDIYGGSRNITVDGIKLNLPHPQNMHAVFLGIGIRF